VLKKASELEPGNSSLRSSRGPSRPRRPSRSPEPDLAQDYPHPLISRSRRTTRRGSRTTRPTVDATSGRGTGPCTWTTSASIPASHERRPRRSKKALFTGLFDGTTDEVAFARSGSFLSRLEHLVAPALEAAPPRVGDAADVEDDPAEREIEALVTAGDESRDTPAPVRAATPTRSATDVQRLFAGLTARRTDRGGLVIEAPPETPRRWRPCSRGWHSSSRQRPCPP
jgi:hypothetical protein